jgi:hypothetical protein
VGYRDCDATDLKKKDKEQTGHAHESNKQRLKRTLRQMLPNEIMAPSIKDENDDCYRSVERGYTPSKSREPRLIVLEGGEVEAL